MPKSTKEVRSFLGLKPTSTDILFQTCKVTFMWGDRAFGELIHHTTCHLAIVHPHQTDRKYMYTHPPTSIYKQFWSQLVIHSDDNYNPMLICTAFLEIAHDHSGHQGMNQIGWNGWGCFGGFKMWFHRKQRVMSTQSLQFLSTSSSSYWCVCATLVSPYVNSHNAYPGTAVFSTESLLIGNCQHHLLSQVFLRTTSFFWLLQLSELGMSLS